LTLATDDALGDGDVVKLPRLAASTYLNSAPVVYALVEGSQRDRCRIEPDPAPSVCARMLATGEVDGALIPSIEYQRIGGLEIARGVCVAARRAVRSVLLVSRLPLEQIRSVALDEQSRTSAALVRILLGRFHDVHPEYAQAPPDLGAMLERADAAMMIGDPAMTADKRGLGVYDLASMWRDATALPFVFALWAVRPERIAPGAVDFAAARREGERAAPVLADRYARRLGLDRDSLYDYLTSSIHYALDAESLAGLELFYRLAAEEGLVDAPAREIAFWPPNDEG
jgi:chorismate dehydratase